MEVGHVVAVVVGLLFVWAVFSEWRGEPRLERPGEEPRRTRMRIDGLGLRNMMVAFALPLGLIILGVKAINRSDATAAKLQATLLFLSAGWILVALVLYLLRPPRDED